MANNYSDATGVLLFDGPAVITPVIRLLFKPFCLDEKPEGDESTRYISVLSEDCDYDWDRYTELLGNNAQRDLGLDIDESLMSSEVLEAIGTHCGVNLRPWIESIDFDGSPTMSDVVRIAQALADGHNLIGHCLEGAWHCDKPRLWEFGGWLSFSGKHYELDFSTSEAMHYAQAIDSAFSSNVGDAATALSRFVRTLLDGVSDEAARETLLQHLADRLKQRDDAVPDAISPVLSTTEGNEWTRTVYLEAFPGDAEADGIRYARVVVNPAFVTRLRVLQALCRERGLSEVRVLDAPDEWGPLDVAEPLQLALPELIVTPTLFWFTARPRGGLCEVETSGQHIDSFLLEAAGPGSPVFIGVDEGDID